MKRAVFLLLSVVLLLTACSPTAPQTGPSGRTEAASGETERTESTEASEPSAVSGDGMPSYAVTIEELPLPEAEDEIRVLDAQGARILYAVQERRDGEGGTFTYYQTLQLGIFDTGTEETVCAWTPETPGNYYGGALLGTQEAVFAAQLDNMAAYPSQYAVFHLGQTQACLAELTGEIQWFLPEAEDSALFSYWRTDGAFGVRRVTAEGCTDALLLQEAAQTQPLGGDLSVCGTAFSYVYVDEGQCCLTIVQQDGTQERTLFDPGQTRFDSCWLTRFGLLACLSLEENSQNAHRALRLFDPESQTERRRPAADGALYQMRFHESMGVAVDSNWNIQVLGISGGVPASRSLDAISLPDGLSGRPGAPLCR